MNSYGCIMRKSSCWALLIVFCAGTGFSQSVGGVFAQDSTQQGNAAPDCSDPTMAGTPQCTGQGQQTSGSNQTSAPMRPPVLTPLPGASQGQPPTSTQPQNTSQTRPGAMPVHPETEFEQMVADSVGHPLPLFGQSLFVQSPSTFSAGRSDAGPQRLRHRTGRRVAHRALGTGVG